MSDYSKLLELYETQYNQAQSDAKQEYEARKKRAEQAYQSAMEALTQNFKREAGQVNTRYDQSRDNQNQTSDRALNEAYLGRLLSQRNLTQQLSAAGKSGGAAESTILALENKYRSDRADTEQNRADNLTKLELSRGGELSQLENQLANGKNNAFLSYNDSVGDAEQAYSAALTAARTGYEKNRAQTLAAQLEEESKKAASAEKASSTGKAASGENSVGGLPQNTHEGIVNRYTEDGKPYADSSLGGAVSQYNRYKAAFGAAKAKLMLKNVLHLTSDQILWVLKNA